MNTVICLIFGLRCIKSYENNMFMYYPATSQTPSLADLNNYIRIKKQIEFLWGTEFSIPIKIFQSISPILSYYMSLTLTFQIVFLILLPIFLVVRIFVTGSTNVQAWYFHEKVYPYTSICIKSTKFDNHEYYYEIAYELAYALWSEKNPQLPAWLLDGFSRLTSYYILAITDTEYSDEEISLTDLPQTIEGDEVNANYQIAKHLYQHGQSALKYLKHNYNIYDALIETEIIKTDCSESNMRDKLLELSKSITPTPTPQQTPAPDD